MNELEKMLDDVGRLSEGCVIFSAAKNAEGKLENSIQIKIPKEAKSLKGFLDGNFTVLATLNKFLLEQEILDFEELKELYSVSLMTAGYAIQEGIDVRDVIAKSEGGRK